MQAIIFPPLPVLLETGCSGQLALNILLTIIGWLPGECQYHSATQRPSAPSRKGLSTAARTHQAAHSTNLDIVPSPLPPPAGVIHAIYISLVMSGPAHSGAMTGGAAPVVTV
jgi:uncharacterized membrane protein YqaE (UPF0057 family)